MNCPYCKHTLKLKEVKQGLHGKCLYCRFAGYLPYCEVKETTEEVKETTEEVREEVRDEVRDEVRERSVKGDNWDCEICHRSYKTKDAFERHLRRVGVGGRYKVCPEEYKAHREYFESLEKKGT